MMGMHTLVFMFSLVFVALTLHGCGSSSDASTTTPSPSPAPTPLAPGGLLISQTFNGVGTMTMSAPSPAPPQPPASVKVKLMIDMDAIRYRMEEVLFINMSQYNITSSTHVAMIFDASKKRLTKFQFTEFKTGPAPKSTKNCTIGSWPTLNEPAVVGKCIQDALANAKPVGSKDGLKEYEMHMPEPGSQSDAVTASFYLDKDNILKKLTVDMTVANMTEHMELTDPDAKAGVPDASIFTVPAEWGACTATAIPPPPKDMPASLQTFYKCVGISKDYVSEVESQVVVV